MRSKLLIITFSFIFAFIGCRNNDDAGIDLTEFDFGPTNYSFEIPESFPPLEQPLDNIATNEGVTLGQHLFYDPILSADSTFSCVNCHFPESGFTDNLAVSRGIDNIPGTRSAMSLVNLAFNQSGMFWDGRSESLEAQALLPIEDVIELHDTWDNVEMKLRRSEMYQRLFREAFGIENSNEITRDLSVKALAQFQRIIISGNSVYDRWSLGLGGISDDALHGFDLFFDLPNEFADAECGHCHNAPLFTTNEYRNNGLDSVDQLTDFLDYGRGSVTGLSFDNGTFRIPTLRNISLTAPYMHDGRFSTLEEVLEHYNSGTHGADNTDPTFIRELGLTEYDKFAIIEFLKSLTDTSYLQNPYIQNPFN